MLKPSDFNNAVPQFRNGNYASNPINPQYVEEPSSTDYNRGAEPLQTLPAQWWNWFINKFTSRFNKVNIYVKNLFNELAQLLSLVNVTPDGTEGSVTDGQLKNAFKELYPTYVSDKLELGTTYVPQTRKVNGHALTGNVTVTKDDVELGNVVNTGDSAVPVSGGTTKFTTGGAYTELNKKVDKTSVTSAVTSGNNNPVTSGGVYDAIENKVDMLVQSNPGGITTYVMIKCENYASLNMLITNRYSDMLIIQSQDGRMVAKKLSSTVSYSLTSIKMFSFSEDNTTKGAVLLKFKGYNPIAIIQLDAQSVYSKSYISQDIFEDPDSNFNNISSYKEYNAMSKVPFIGTPVPPSSNGNYALQCKVSSEALSYNWKDSDVTIPSDAVLHYSFDDVPDLPDGTAVYRKNNDFTTTNDWSTNANLNILSIVNNCLHVESLGTWNNSSIWSTYLESNNFANKLVKIRFRASNVANVFTQDRGGDYTNHYLSYKSLGGNLYEVCVLTESSYTYNQALIIQYTDTSADNYVTIMQFYIGDGSYSTPIIDNASGEWNSITASGVAVKGVNGKGLKCFKNSVNGGAFNLSDNFSISLWINPENSTEGLKGDIINKPSQFILRNGAGFGNYLMIYIYINDTENFKSSGGLLTANQWTHLVVTKNGTALTVFKDAVKTYEYTLPAGELHKNNTDFNIGNVSNTRPQSYDDLLIFDRALTADEVQALYLNKANTPKFYDINNYNIDNATPVPAQNSNNLFTTGGAYDFFGGNITKEAWLGKVFGWGLGRNWISTTVPLLTKIKVLKKLNGIFLAGSNVDDSIYQRGLWWSEDGKHYTQCTYGSNSFDYSVTSIEYDWTNNLWLVGTTSNGIWWSENGKSFTQCTWNSSVIENKYILDISTSMGNFCSISNTFNSNDGLCIGRSTNGKYWTWTYTNPLSINDKFTKIYSTGSYTFFLGDSNNSNKGFVFNQNDGNSFTELTYYRTGSSGDTSYFDFPCYSMFSYGLMYVVGTSQGMYYSTSAQGPYIKANTEIVTNIYCSDGIWIACKQTGGLLRSTDGINWNTIDGVSDIYTNVMNAYGLWIACNDTKTISSKDTILWTKSYSVSYSVEYDNRNGMWLLGGLGVMYSGYSQNFS